MTEPLKLAVVGHTNVGKTSLLRTLTRDVGFGEVSHRPSTTRHVEGARLSVDGQPLLELYDTPGLEDAIALLDYLERLEQPGERLDGPERLARFLASSEARQRFEQEAKVLRQLLASDAGLYVIDAREPVLAKYRDELQVRASCGKPLLPVLNFVASSQHREPEWREALARLGLHALVRFDSVAPPEDGERRLYESLALLLESARPALQRLIDDQQAQRLARRLCPTCKAPLDVPRKALIDAGFKPEDLDGSWTPYKPVGCSACNNGYKGRVGIYQVMPISEEIQRIILKGGGALDIAQQAGKEGVRTLRESGLLKVRQGMTSLEEVLSVTNE